MLANRTTSRIVLLSLLILTLVTTSVFAAEAMQTLELGMTGRSVMALQEALKSLDYDIIPDGMFGPNTKRAVTDLQKQHDLYADGVVGTKTWSLISRLEEKIVYTVRPGDTLWSLSKRYGVSIDTIRVANGLNSDTIVAGAKLFLPTDDAIGGTDNDTQIYRVRRGDTLQNIAHRYGTTVDFLADLNDKNNPNRLHVGEELVIPASGGRLQNLRFSWPVRGRISSPFGWRVHPVFGNRRFHSGLDVAVSEGTPVRAAESGVVLEAGHMGGFGLGIIIDHGSGIQTLYGHNSKLLVRAGQYINKGDIIAKSGNTGLSTGPHVHFEIKVYDQSVNPYDWLPN